MIEYLQEWLVKRGGTAPVWVSLTDEPSGHSYTMTAVDSVGIVLATAGSSNVGVAYPWSAIASVLPERHES